MCLAVPMKVTSIENDMATADYMGTETRACTAFLPGVKVGDYILVHAGFAMEVLDEESALEALKLWKELEDLSFDKKDPKLVEEKSIELA